MAVNNQSTNRAVGDVTVDADVLWRGSVELTTENQGPTSIYAPYYYVSWTKDIDFLNIDDFMPEIEVYAATESAGTYDAFFKCPFMTITDSNDVTDGAGHVQYAVRVGLNIGATKTSGRYVNVFINAFSRTQSVARTFFITVKKGTRASVDGTFYPSEGSFT